MKTFKNFIFKLINYTIKLSKKNNSTKVLGAVSLLESIILPIPPDLFLIPMVLGKKNKWLYLSLYCTFFSILGGIIGYLIGYFFWDILGTNIVNFYNAQNKILILKEQFAKYGWFIIVIAGFTPLPYKIFTIGSGLLTFNFFIFILCSIISRGLRFVTLSYLVYKYGEKSLKLVESHFLKLTLLLFLALIIMFILIYS